MVLINRDYRLLWAGQLVSQIGDFAFSTTLALWIGTVVLADRSYAPAAVSALVVVVAVGTLLVGPRPGCSSTGGTTGGRCWAPTSRGPCSLAY
ncbi:hypothetical protein ACWGKW_22925 [Streptomyces sp. NPDC054766]